MPPIAPKLIDQKEAADMLGLCLSNFKKLEREEALLFKRRMVGCSVRYREIDMTKIMIPSFG